MKLRDMLPPDAAYDPSWGGTDVRGISADSRSVRPGDIFVALTGSRADGVEFLAQAAAAGAAAFLAERFPAGALPADARAITVPNARRALALIAARFFPRQPHMIAAVTGTSGKTSIVAFLRQIWERQGFAAASIGTVGVVTPHGADYGSLTTPDPVKLQHTIDDLAGKGISHLALEASSHGLDQHRLDAVRLKIGAFTNLSRDHLDYHPTMEAYLTAKLRLFTELLPHDGAAVVNADDPYASRAIAAARGRGLRVFTVGRAGRDLVLRKAARDGFAQRLMLSCAGKSASVRLPLVGAFQVENALVAAGMAIVSGCDPDAVFAAVEKLEGAKGRLERVGTHNGAPIFVDYAHKPDALAKALDALRPFADGRLIVVFGAGGDRDQGKRPLMGAIAAAKSDRVIVTDDNPRSEEPAAIRAAILAAAPGAVEIADRGEAIRAAVAMLAPGDVLLIAGKGHESGQIIGDRVVPFTDHDAVATALKGKAA